MLAHIAYNMMLFKVLNLTHEQRRVNPIPWAL